MNGTEQLLYFCLKFFLLNDKTLLADHFIFYAETGEWSADSSEFTERL